MQNLKNKSIAILIATILTISIGTSIALVNAHTPAWQIPTYSFCNVSPNPIGVGQTANVNFWLNCPPPTANAQFGDLWTNMTVVITKPDGTTQTLGPFTSDATGGSHTTYTPTAVGNYTFQFVFAGETLLGRNTAGGGTSTNAYVGDYFQPSKSNLFKLTVQEEPIGYPSTVPLPSSYWTRPIYGENNNWNVISGNWLGLGVSTFAATGMYNITGNYNPYTTAPNTAHILWTKPEAFGGIIGGEFGNSETANYYSTSQYEPKFAPIIMQGILYYTMYPGASTYPAGWAAVDLRTGETIWEKTNTTLALRCGQILQMTTPNQFGGHAFLWATGSIPGVNYGTTTGTTYNMFDAMTGNYILSIVNASSMTLTEDENGNLIGYYVNSTVSSAPTLNMWNSTRCINIGQGGNPASGYPTGLADNWMWRPRLNAVLPFYVGTQWTAPLATTLSGQPISLGISAINSGVVLMTQGSAAAGAFQLGWQIEAGYSSVDGHQLWAPLNRTEVMNSRIISGSTCAGYGVFVEFDSSALTATGYSLFTGVKLWGPIELPNISPYSSLGQQNCIANGVIYDWTYGGDVYAIQMATGKINWEYHSRPADLESPYGIWPLWTFSVGSIADGKLFVPEGHMYSPPLFHEARQLAINLTDGSTVWYIDAFDVTSAPAISDGIMVTLNAYDNQIYAWGKGPTALTATAPNVGVTTATPIVIRGSITDISPGTKQGAPAANFPFGVPCVSDASMTNFMEAVYMQQPMPTNTTGVPISVSVLDSNGNFREIGRTTSDGSGMYTLTWTPDIPGDYTVVASFAGSEAYYSSSAETSFTVGLPTPTTAPTPVPEKSMADQYFIPAIAGLFVFVAVIGIAIILLIRKRP